jgi:hypothetical protein
MIRWLFMMMQCGSSSHCPATPELHTVNATGPSSAAITLATEMSLGGLAKV